MDFGALPPEINSARMYSGPGSGPMLAAAIAWDRLADDLDSTTASYRSVISALTSGPWQGAASTSMAAATPPYLAWMTTTGAQAEQTAAQARAAVTAYETAYAMMVPPPVIAANRAQLMLLMATNVLGQNTPAIAATEAQYGEMWAQDAAAMYGYAGDSAAVATLTPFTPPTEITDSAGLTGQAAAVAQATSTAAADNVQSMMLTAPQLTSALQTVLQGLASPVAAMQSASPLSSLSTLNAVVSPISSAMSGLSSSMSSLSSGASIMDSLNPTGNSLGPATSAASNVPVLAPAVETSSGAGTLGSAGLSASGGAVSAGTGRAATVGALSVPQTWATATTTTVPTAAAALQDGGYSAAPDVSAGSPTGMLGGMPLTAGARRGTGGATAPRVGIRTVMPPPTVGG